MWILQSESFDEYSLEQFFFLTTMQRSKHFFLYEENIDMQLHTLQAFKQSFLKTLLNLVRSII